ncbi:Xaa-Pro dipeptidyl-peptidase [Actinoallomurus soli]|uniref:Xaa-Pro dipeptidyl-peptidase n=1 Tax=Actinoallomurus soli TaxID=2952535 RepID=UPI002092D7A9|nr:Xaa-Pro dipeptidyl-peptidase [Actinoallomurus soli]MCO5973741.1 Xaa-Pro dipeptidyl-peptidase [Actinoallomurus soli]
MRQRTLGVVLAITAVTAVPAVSAHPAQAAPSPHVTVSGGETQPVFSRADAITQTVNIEVPVDSDHDGVRDRVQMRIMRPKETDQGLKVPTIVEPSPYWAGGNDVPNHDVDIDGLSARGLRQNRSADVLAGAFPGYYDNYFLPRGYAVADLDSLGTGGSTGCPTSGARNEQAGARAAVDWLTGRARGWAPDGTPVKATWSTGNVGMIGQSYDGTLPNMAAATGVPGLKAIVPIAGISSWYDYYRANGGVVAPGGFQGEDLDVLAKYVYTRPDREICRQVIADIEARQDRDTGDYSRFWDERNYVQDARKVRAAVFVVHGLNDWNVKTKQSVQWWNALARAGVPRKLWLHQANHNTPFRWRIEEWLRQTHHWFDHWLYGIDNGIMQEPRVDIERAPGQWEQHADWPEPGTRTVDLHLNASGDLAARPQRGAAQSMVDAGRTRTAEQLAADPATSDPNRLVYLTPELTKPVRVGGTPRISLRASLDGRSPYLTALLVDYGTDTRPTGAVASTGEQVCYGEGVPGDDGCTTRTAHVTETKPFKIVTRGWLDARNRHDPARTEPVKAGKMYDFTWDLQPNDYVFKAGHRLGVVVLSTDYDYTLRYPAGTRLSVRPGVSTLHLPVAPR